MSRRSGIGGVAAGAMLAGAAWIASAAAVRGETACPDAGGEAVTVAAVEPRLELRLNDGRVLRLAGLDPAAASPEAPDREEAARDALLKSLAGRPVTIQLLATAPDRWGRFAARAFAGPGAEGGLATAAVAAGLGRYLAEPAAHACRAALVAAEAEARRAGRGLWADPYYSILAVDDAAAFAERAGTTVVVEGQVASVRPGPFRTTLVFTAPATAPADGVPRTRLLTATLTPKVAKTMAAGGLSVPALAGRRVRIRGLLDLRFGPQIELTGQDDIDLVEAVADPPPASAAAGPK